MFFRLRPVPRILFLAFCLFSLVLVFQWRFVVVMIAACLRQEIFRWKRLTPKVLAVTCSSESSATHPSLTAAVSVQVFLDRS
jgi:hypothetical protein